MAPYLGAIAGICIGLARAYVAGGSKEARMSETASQPWHLWAVGPLSLMWNGLGGYDFLMKNLRVPTYVDQLPAEAIQFIDELPLWTILCWALGVWGAVLGSVLLLLARASRVKPSPPHCLGSL
jgi:hypothetical protein